MKAVEFPLRQAYSCLRRKQRILDLLPCLQILRVFSLASFKGFKTIWVDCGVTRQVVPLGAIPTEPLDL